MLLMNKNNIVADISLNESGNISAINTIHNKALLPVGVFPKDYTIGLDKPADSTMLNNWWKNNSIPAERDSIRLGLECIGVKDQNELKILSHGISLTNHYWIKDNDEKLSWEEVNYWEHPFSQEIGIALFNHKPVKNDISTIGASPDASLNGTLKKKWIILDNEYYIQKSGSGLNKEEVFNEVLISEVLNAAQINNADYQLYFEDGEVSCIAKCFTNADHQLVPLCQILESVKRRSTFPFQTELEHLYDVLEYYNVKGYKKYINDLLCIDYMFAGTDRHYNNIALLYNDQKNEFCFSPVFDSGTCLWANKPTKNIAPLDDQILARPICNKNTFGTWEEQKKYITDYIKLPKQKLLKALMNYINNTGRYSEMSSDRIMTIAVGCIKRVNRLQNYLISEKKIKIAKDRIVTNEDIEWFEAYLSENKSLPENINPVAATE